MNKKGDLSDSVMMNYAMHLILLVIFTIIMFYFVIGYQEGAFGLEDIYAKEIVRIIDSAEPGSQVFIDVTEITAIAFKSGKSPSEIFAFDNVNNRVTVNLKSGGTSFRYFNEVDIVDVDLELPSPGAGTETNRLTFRVVEAARHE